jgi:hypothetical protein
MKTVQLIWIAGLISAPIAGWYTAMLKDADRGTQVTAAKPVAPAAEQVEAPPQPPAAPDELTRTKADLAKLLTALQAPDANSAIENYTVVKSQVNDLTAARDVATAALYKAGAANFEEATNRIADLTRQLADERRAADKSRRLVASLEALRDAQGWHSPSCPSNSVQASKVQLNPTQTNPAQTSLSPVAQQQPPQQPVVAPVEVGQVIVCFQ